MPPPEFATRIMIYVLDPPRDVLYEKINRRTEMHFAAGLVEEVRELRASGIADSTNALGSHGYRRVCEYLRGERTLESAVEQSKQDVRNYAKRQLTWFRREPDTRWLHGFGDEPEIVNKMLTEVSGRIVRICKLFASKVYGRRRSPPLEENACLRWPNLL